MTRDNFFSNLDKLVKIANPKVTNLDSLNMSLDELKDKQNALKIERKDLKSEMTDDRYYDATSEIVDRNNVVNLKKKITKLNAKIKECEKDLSQLIKSEEQTHVKLIGLEAGISEDTLFLESLNGRIDDIKNKPESDLSDYEDTIKLATDNLNNSKEAYDSLNKEYEVIVKNLEATTDEKTKLDTELAKTKDELSKINEALKTREKYMNRDLKESDDERLAKLDEEIKALDEKKLDIINNPVFISNEIKEYIDNDDIVSAMNKTKELIAIIEAMPYMDIEDNNKLKELKSSLEQEKIDFVSFINKKNYDEINLDFVQARIVYLNNLINNYNEEIDFTCKKIRKIDDNVKTVTDNLKTAIKEVEIIETDITLYQNILNDDENMPLSRKHAIEAILAKKEEELNILNRVISSYRLEQTKVIKDIKEVDNNTIASLKDKIAACENEKEELNKVISSLKTKNHDILAEESDKEILHQFDERLETLENRLKITDSISEIKNNIDAFFDKEAINNEETDNKPVTFEPVSTNEETKPEVKNDLDLNFVDFDDNKFLDIPESNVVSINDIINDDTQSLPPLFKEDTETINIFDNYDTNDESDDMEFQTVTNFDLPKFTFQEVKKEEVNDDDLLEVVDISPIVVDENKGE